MLDLSRKHEPDRSIPGIALATISLVVMPILSAAKKRVGTHLRSDAMHADARQTDFCVYLSAILLVGLVAERIFWLVVGGPCGGVDHGSYNCEGRTAKYKSKALLLVQGDSAKLSFSRTVITTTY
jgi:hypothetical protein